MPGSDPGPEWIIANFLPTTSTDGSPQEELILSAKRVWPQIQSQANRELGAKRHDPENATLAAEVWEGVLESIARSFHRLRTSCAEIVNMDSYLIGAFRHRFSRACRRQLRREQTLQLVASADQLDVLAAKQGICAALAFERRVLAKEILTLMDMWLRRVWTAREYGYSWKEIARYLGGSEQGTKMKFRYKLSLLRGRLKD
jgi:DNA-directed RNA polymerase specialized sigma24 family protein